MAIRATTVAQDKDLAILLRDQAEISIDIDAVYILEWVRDNFAPDQVFDEDELARWAKDNDYYKEEWS